MTCELSPKLQTNSGKRKNSRLLFSRQTPVPRYPRHENLWRQPAPANLQQEIEMCATIINVSVMRPENAYSLALSRETTEPAVNSRYGGRRNQPNGSWLTLARQSAFIRPRFETSTAALTRALWLLPMDRTLPRTEPEELTFVWRTKTTYGRSSWRT